MAAAIAPTQKLERAGNQENHREMVLVQQPEKTAKSWIGICDGGRIKILQERLRVWEEMDVEQKSTNTRKTRRTTPCPGLVHNSTCGCVAKDEQGHLIHVGLEMSSENLIVRAPYLKNVKNGRYNLCGIELQKEIDTGLFVNLETFQNKQRFSETYSKTVEFVSLLW